MNEKEEKLADRILDEALAAKDLDERSVALGHYMGLTKSAEQRTRADLNWYQNILIIEALEAKDKK